MRNSFRRIPATAVLASFVSVMCWAAALGDVGPEQGYQLVSNGDIESLDKDGNIVGWSTSSWNGGQGKFSVSGDITHSGKRTLKIEKEEIALDNFTFGNQEQEDVIKNREKEISFLEKECKKLRRLIALKTFPYYYLERIEGSEEMPTLSEDFDFLRKKQKDFMDAELN